MKFSFSTLAFIFLSNFCFADVNEFTTLLPEGNHEVARRFDAFEQSNKGCAALGEGPRVILTGFGKFEGLAYNISGAIIENLSSSAFWPDSVDSSIALPSNPSVPFQNGILTDSDRGARIYNRQFLIAGRTVNTCLIIADVLWDFSGAIFAREMERFRPQVVVMTGVGYGSLEAGAINHAIESPGFAPNGDADTANTPQTEQILPDLPLDSTVAMSWDNVALEKLVAPKVAALGFSLYVPLAAQPSNDYVCNNVSYLVLQAALHHQLTLAGGELILKPDINSNPKIGFFHYPATASLEQAPQWAQVLLTLVQGSL